MEWGGGCTSSFKIGSDPKKVQDLPSELVARAVNHNCFKSYNFPP